MATKKKGGPQTQAGKAVAAKNSIKYGLTSSKPSTPKEKSVVQAHIEELTSYYKPESPLEKLQIERIAICKAKLDRLYEVEEIQLQLATEKFARDPDQILDQIDSATGIIRGMVKEQINYGVITLPCKLTDQSLELICEEISGFRKKILRESDFEIYWPHLTRYLRAYELITDSLIKKLEVISEKIEHLLNSKDEYRERFKDLTEIIFKATQQFKPEPDPPTEHEIALDCYLQQQKEARDAEKLRRRSTKPAPELVVPEEPLIDQATLSRQLQAFTEILESRNASRDVYEQYMSIKELMIRGVTLPQKESDLLMRYQTALDRRLSTAMGELLHLQSRRGAK